MGLIEISIYILKISKTELDNLFIFAATEQDFVFKGTF